MIRFRTYTLLLCLFICAHASSQSNTHVGFQQLDSTGVRLNHHPGVYSSSVELVFESPNGVSLYYSMNDGDSAQFRKYTGAITLQSNTFLRVKLSGSNADNKIYQGNYIIGRETTLPVICLRVRDSEFFPPTGIYDGHFSGSGPHKERVGNAFDKKPIRCFVEFIYGEKSVFSTSCWVKTFGGFTLALPEKSLHLVADASLGESEFRYKFFSSKPYNEFEHLVLRTSGSDQNDTRFKDMSLSSLAADMGLDYMAYQPCIFYVNDKYFGIINLREKINNDYLGYNHHALKDSTELLELHGGHSKDYMQLFHDLETQHDAADYDVKMDEIMDVENYMNFSILQIYISNSDSRGNIRFWKAKNLDNRWRWIFYDSDLGCRDKYQNINFLKDRISAHQTQWYNPPWATHILRNLTTNPQTRDRFINQVCLMQATRMHHDTIMHRIEHFAKWLEPEIPYHVNRYPVESSSERQWLKSIERLKDFFILRKETFHEHMCTTFGLEEDRVQLSVSSNFPNESLLTANHSDLRFTHIDGLFYKGRSIHIQASSNFPYLFESWKEDGLKSDQREIDLSANSTWTALYRHAGLDTLLHERMGIAGFGTEMKSKEEVHWIALFNTTGKKLSIRDFKLHLCHSGETIAFEEASEWEDSTYIIITNHPKKWKKRHPEFSGEVIESDWLNHFVREASFFLSYNNQIVDSLFLQFPDSLLAKGDRWTVWRDSLQTAYLRGDAFTPDIRAHRHPVQVVTNDQMIVPRYIYYTAEAILLLLIPIFIFYKRKKHAA
jgi:hypothetical protein